MPAERKTEPRSMPCRRPPRSARRGPCEHKDAAFNWEDPLDLEGELTGEERMVRDTARGYAQDKLFPRAARLPRGALRPRRGVRDGRARPARPHHPGGVRRGRPRLRGLRADHPRDRARRFRLPLGDVGAVLAGHASDLRLRQRGAAPQVSPQAGRRRDRRLLRAHRARSRLRSGLDGDARKRRRAASASPAARCGSATRRSPTSRWSGRSSTASSAASWWSAARWSSPSRSKASCRCAPRSPARSCSRMHSCRRRTCCPTCRGWPGRSAASTWRAPASPGA